MFARRRVRARCAAGGHLLQQNDVRVQSGAAPGNGTVSNCTTTPLPLHLPSPQSPFAIPETQSAFHLRAQPNAFRRDARQQSRLFGLTNPRLTPHPPTPTRFTEVVSDDLLVPHAANCACFSLHTA